MPPPALAIVEEIKADFPQKRERRFKPMVNSVQDDEPLQIEADFADKDDWTKLEPEWLDASPNGLGTALIFLSDEAVRFYIPAYLVADLMGLLKAVDPTYALVHGFDDMSRGRCIRPREARTWTDDAFTRWNGLTRPQAIAVVHYLEWRIERDSLDLEWKTAEALAAYWYVRAAGLQPDFSSAEGAGPAA